MLRLLPHGLFRFHWAIKLPLFSRLLYAFLLAHILDIGIAIHLGRIWGHFPETALLVVTDLPLTVLLIAVTVRSIVRAYSVDC